MKKMNVARTGIAFDPKETANILSIKLPPYTEILSVKATKNNDNNYLGIVFFCPSESYSDESGEWCEFQFLIAKSSYVEIEIDNHKYIGSVDVGDATYAVFYKKMQQT